MGPEWLTDDGFTARLSVTLRRDRFLRPGTCFASSIAKGDSNDSDQRVFGSMLFQEALKDLSFLVKVSLAAAGDSPALFSVAFWVSRVYSIRCFEPPSDLTSTAVNRGQPWSTLVQYASMVFVFNREKPRKTRLFLYHLYSHFHHYFFQSTL